MNNEIKPENSSVKQDETAKDDGRTNGEPHRDAAAAVFDWVEMFVAAFAIVIMLITFIGRYSPVIGSSMFPTLKEGDVLIMSDIGYTPKQGDIVVFQNSWLYNEPFVKRVIAVAGQTVDIDFDTWTVTVDGVALDESYVNRIEASAMRGSDYVFPMVIPEGHIFCMGDNRNYSTDSRDSRVGPVDERFVIGHVICRVWPFSRVGTF